MAPIVPVILSGGAGTRLWPLSRGSAPKQLQSLIGRETMLQATAARVAHLPGRLTVVANAGQIEQIIGQLPPETRVIGEPVPRNTAPAVAAAALLSRPDELLLILPADHHLQDPAALRQALEAAAPAAATGSLVTFGVVPTRNETGYGYIVPGPASETGGQRIAQFVEKPDPATAADLVERGAFWNSGMFMFKAEAVLDELASYQPLLVERVRAAVSSATDSGAALLLGSEFGEAPSISVDVAVMEPTGKGVVVPLAAGWSDVGSWASLWELGRQDQQANVTAGPVFSLDTKGSYLRSEGPLVAVIGAEDLVVVATADAVLVTSRERAQDVKAMVEMLEGRPELH